MLITEALDIIDSMADDAALARHGRGTQEGLVQGSIATRTEAREAVAAIVAYLVPDGVRLPSSPLVVPHEQ